MKTLPSILAASLLFLPLPLSLALVAEEPKIELYRKIEIPGNLIDKSKLSQSLAPNVWHDVFGGISALEHVSGDLYWALADRGPKDGAIDWACRVHLVRIPLFDRDADSISVSTEPVSIERTVMLGNGRDFFHGFAERFEAGDGQLERLDPEGIRIASSNSNAGSCSSNFYLSDEYGPHLLEFTSAGSLVRRFDLPNRYKIANPGITKQEENAANESGRQGNRGIEGLAISQDGTKLFGIFQSPLLQDSTRHTNGKQKKPKGKNCRLMELTVSDQSIREYLYPLQNSSNKLNEILTIEDGRFLVIERDGKPGKAAEFKKLMLVELSGASDISEIATLPAYEIPPSIEAVSKTEFLDLLDPQFGLAGGKMPEKLESLAFGPDLPDGRKLLLVVSDNDFETSESTWIYCFAIPQESLQKTTKQELAGT